MLHFRNTNEHKTQRAAFCECCANNMFTSNLFLLFLLLYRGDTQTHTAAFLRVQPFNHKQLTSFVASSSVPGWDHGRSMVCVLWMAFPTVESSNKRPVDDDPTKATVPTAHFLLITETSPLLSCTKTWLSQRGRHRRHPPSKTQTDSSPSPASRKRRLRRLSSSTVKRQELNRWTTESALKQKHTKSLRRDTTDDELPENQINWIPARV